MNELIPSEIGKAAEEAVKFFKELILPPIKPPLEELGEFARDEVRYWRFLNQVKILNKANEKLKKMSIRPVKVPSKLLFPLLEYGSLEDEEDMIEKWANLLYHAANPDSKSMLNLNYIETLKRITPQSALILDKLYEFTLSEISGGKILGKEIIQIHAIDSFNICVIKETIFEKETDDLRILGLISIEGIFLGEPQGEIIYLKDKSSLHLSRFGYNFVKACRV